MYAEKVRKTKAVAAMIVATILLVTIALTVTNVDNAFAYSKSQATTAANDCGNGQVATNIGCQNIASQIQGDENSVAITAQQTFPAVVRELPTTPEPEPTCEGCFATLSLDDLSVFEEAMAALTSGQINSVEELCAFLETATPEQQQQMLVVVNNALLVALQEDEDAALEILVCIADFFGIALP